MSGAEITTKDDLVQIVRDKFSTGLKQLGFQIAQSDSAPRRVSVELRLLSYGTSQGFFTGGVGTKGAVKAFAECNGKKFEKNYHAEEEERAVVVPTAGHNSELLNKILDQTLLKVFTDEEFREFLRG